MNWILISLQLVPNELQSGFFVDFAKIMNSNVWKEIYVVTENMGNFTLQGKTQYVLTPSKTIITVDNSLLWLTNTLNKMDSLFPGSKILCVIASHGTGKSLKIKNEEYIPLYKLRKAILESNRKPDILALDCCFMATTFVRRQLQNTAQYLLASSDYIGWEGWMSPNLEKILSLGSVIKIGKALVDDFISRSSREKEGATSASLISLTSDDNDIAIIDEKDKRCQVEDKTFDYKCVTGKTHPSIVYAQNCPIATLAVLLQKKPASSGMNITTLSK
jgi:hypothetical protein